jgi:hypothetical protein
MVHEGPGPCNYSPAFRTIQPNVTFRFSFGSRPDTAKLSLGPGSNINSGSGFGPSSGSGSGSGSGSVPGPGPGHYAINRTLDPRGCATFGHSARPSSVPRAVGKSFAPGPASYDVNHGPRLLSPPRYRYVMRTKYRFGSNKRGSTASALCPGPGSYDISNYLSRNSPRAILCSRARQSLDMSVPGPGAYEPRSPNKTVAYFIPTQKRNRDRFDAGPGPSTYSPTRSFKLGPQHS